MCKAPNSASLLSLIAPLFSHLSEQEYADVRENPGWAAAHAAGERLGANAAECEAFACASALPTWPARSLAQNELLVPGMPLAALPVESLYKPWSAASGNAYGAQRGLFLGDAARHLQAVYAALDLEVPHDFAAMPDHLTLVLDLLVLFLENGNMPAAAELAASHLDWLGDYDAALAHAAENVAGATCLSAQRAATLAQGIAHLRALVRVAGLLVREATGAQLPAVQIPQNAGFAASLSASFEPAAPAPRTRPARTPRPHSTCAQPLQEPLALCGDVR